MSRPGNRYKESDKETNKKYKQGICTNRPKIVRK